MKPNPHPIHQARRAFGAKAGACALVGDSASDIQAAHADGTGSIGYTNKPWKRRRLTDADADAVADTITDLAKALTAHPVAAYEDKWK